MSRKLVQVVMSFCYYGTPIKQECLKKSVMRTELPFVKLKGNLKLVYFEMNEFFIRSKSDV